MQSENKKTVWKSGSVPVAVVLISLNEAHNMESVLHNLKEWAQEVFLVDSYSADETVDIAISHGVHVVQRKFQGFGDQWNFALSNLPISAPWTMKIDPDERLSDKLKTDIAHHIKIGSQTGISFYRRLWFMGKPLPIKHKVLRVWKTGSCKFSDVSVNEHPIVKGEVIHIDGIMDHYDSPNLHHWVDKQNRYTSAEAISLFSERPLSAAPRLFGTKLERRMWFKKHFIRIPFRYFICFIINLCQVKVWKSGKIGLSWARLRVWARRMKEDKIIEMQLTRSIIILPKAHTGLPHPKAIQSDKV